MTDTTQDVNEQAEAQDAEAADQNAGSEQDSQPTGFDALPAETKAEIRKLRRENAGLRTQVKSFEDSSKTESERQAAAFAEMAARAESAERRLNDAIKRDALTQGLLKANVRNLKGALRMVDLETLELAEDGTVANIDGALESLRADVPEFFRGVSLDGGKSGPGQAQDFNAMIRAKAGRKR